MSGFTGNNTGFGNAGGPAPNTDGPHKSDMMNKADPRVDSNRDHSTNMGMNPSGTADATRQGTSQAAYRDGVPAVGGAGGIGGAPGAGGIGGTTHSAGGIGGTTHGAGGIGGTTHSAGGIGGSSGLPEGSVGPHGSRAANAADPRVDSDLDSSRRTGATGTTGLGSSTHTTGTTGIGSSTHTTGTTGIGSSTHSSGLPEGSVGPHGSRAANAADPRVDSDLDSSRRTGATGTSGLGSSTHTSGHTGTTGTTGTTGHTGTSGLSGATAASTGPAPNTAGPHKSDLLNKADPRVDSNLDGSKTVGGDKTFSGVGRTA